METTTPQTLAHALAFIGYTRLGSLAVELDQLQPVHVAAFDHQQSWGHGVILVTSYVVVTQHQPDAHRVLYWRCPLGAAKKSGGYYIDDDLREQATAGSEIALSAVRDYLTMLAFKVRGGLVATPKDYPHLDGTMKGFMTYDSAGQGWTELPWREEVEAVLPVFSVEDADPYLLLRAEPKQD